MEPNFHQRSLDGYEKLKITKIFNNKVDEQANNAPGGCEVISVVACAVCNHIPSIRRMTQDASKILATKKSHRARRVMQLLWYTHLGRTDIGVDPLNFSSGEYANIPDLIRPNNNKFFHDRCNGG